MSMWTLLLDGWTRVWLFPMPRPGRLHSQRFLLPEMMTPHPGGPRLHLELQTDDPWRQWDGPGHLWEEPGGWKTLESPHREFLATLDPEDKIKERSINDDEDEDGDHKKVSAAQYQLFRQAITTSKGSFKVNPAKTSRASRASLLYLGDSKVTDRVSWLDQPSLKDADASTARIAQGLKEDEGVEKTTLSETLNTTSSTFKHLTVKQIFPREPYRLEVHRDARYVPKPPGDNGFSDSKAPSSYQMSHCICLDTEELARRSAISASLADSMVASAIEDLSPKDGGRSFWWLSWPLSWKPVPQRCQRPLPIFSCCTVTPCWRALGSSLRSCLQWELHHWRALMC